MKIIVWQTAFLGDLILTTPLFSSLKKLYPSAYLSVITKPFGKEVLKNNPDVDHLITFNKKTMSNWELIKSIKSQKYDLAISPHRSHRASYSLFLARIPERIGFDKGGFSFLYTKKVPHRFDGTHEIERNLKLLSVLPEYDSQKLEKIPKLPLDEREENSYKRFNLKDKDYIIIAPGSKWETKRWTAKGYGQVIDRLLQEGENIVTIGSPEDKEFTDKVLQYTKHKDSVKNLVGKTNLRETFSIIKHGKLLISNDSAPVHMAVAYGTPVVDIYGPTVTEFGFYPYRKGKVVEIKNLECRPCGLHGHRECPIGTHECMEKISPDLVLENVQNCLQNC
ncbi:MAG: lipopolysaccharide heptosyltransferase II [Aquificae bacterium]|nr:lipopolysaccharide heptosyltransferase II [Aquificota bacterium]